MFRAYIRKESVKSLKVIQNQLQEKPKALNLVQKKLLLQLICDEKSLKPVVVAHDLGHVKVSIWVIEEDVERHLGPLLLDVLDEDGDLHGSPDLLPDGGHPGGVGHQGVHGDSILDN